VEEAPLGLQNSRKMNLKQILWLLIFVLVPTVALQAESQTTETMIDHKEEVGLSDQQLAEISVTLRKFTADLKILRSRKADLETQLKQLEASQASEDEVERIRQELASTLTGIRRADRETAERVTQILTPQQLDKWKRIQKRVREARGTNGDDF
jgi:uncharacterized protein YlxW (UPF0749 family)